ncbi:hypothetical protein [Stenotrophomonas maltophilia]|uniref:hypothetical protein n=1 Tax=Stenotrophomonas maltophilia TaxID=40324 RepID=UPI0013DB5D3F|nr:hypothetical protein [Stenotrophomonas maltophilia]
MSLVTQSIDAIKSLLPSVSEGRAKLQAAYEEVRGCQKTLNAERDSLLKLPLAKDDLIAVMHAEIDAAADGYLKMAADKLRDDIVARDSSASQHSPKVCVGDIDRTRKHFRGRMLGQLRMATGYSEYTGDNPTDSLTQHAATFLFRDEMKRAAAQVVEAMQYPFPNAKSLVEVRARLIEIDSELASLGVLRGEVEAQAKALGITLSDEPAKAVPSPAPVDEELVSEDETFTYHVKHESEITPTGDADVIRTFKETGIPSYFRQEDVPKRFHAALDAERAAKRKRLKEQDDRRRGRG